MGDFGADTLRDSIEEGWALTGRVAKVVSAGVEHVVYFFAHPQHPSHEWPKSVEVRKINTAGDENVIEHSRFEDIEDVFEITCRYRIGGTIETLYDQAEQDIEDMQEEVVRIVKTVYSPLAGTGVYFRTVRQWRNDDRSLNASKPELARTLRLVLIKIKSQTNEVFEGYKGTLVFDTSQSSNMDTAPAIDYTYTECFEFDTNEGTPTISVMTRNSSSGTGQPAKFRGKFAGQFTCVMYAKKSDLDNTPDDTSKLDNIYKAQANGQLSTVALVDVDLNLAGDSLVVSTFLMITNMRRRRVDEDLMKYYLTGDITKPSVTAIL